MVRCFRHAIGIKEDHIAGGKGDPLLFVADALDTADRRGVLAFYH